MKTMLMAALAATALVANAGEDSTDRWGSAGIGPAYWETPCGLRGFANADAQAAPCASPSPTAAQDMSVEEMRALMQQHTERMDEMIKRMNAEHRAMMGGTGGGSPGAGGAAR